MSAAAAAAARIVRFFITVISNHFEKCQFAICRYLSVVISYFKLKIASCPCLMFISS
jgi:hypothetical protein